MCDGWGLATAAIVIVPTGLKEALMPTTSLPLYKVGALALTRAALGAGVGLLVADRLELRTRRAVGGVLLAVGLLSTVPLVMSIVEGIGASGPSAS
jgi:hypothetical protein